MNFEPLFNIGDTASVCLNLRDSDGRNVTKGKVIKIYGPLDGCIFPDYDLDFGTKVTQGREYFGPIIRISHAGVYREEPIEEITDDIFKTRIAHFEKEALQMSNDQRYAFLEQMNDSFRWVRWAIK